ncbi:unnamed protein product [marine sediment metagenome]|uniref:Uncharacterized protein n=1 Tax=marine sediment metagenome TaxID=412755 RepID=X1AEA6_9ZZZZ
MVGMKADDVLKQHNRSAAFAIANPTHIDDDEYGHVVAWHYEDCDIILHRRDGCYRVREVLRVH